MKKTYKSLYPNITLQHNISPNSQEGLIVIPDKIYKNENTYNTLKYNRAGEFIENMICDCHIEFCHRWFGLANFQEMLDDLFEYIPEHLRGINPQEPMVYMSQRGINPLYDASVPVEPLYDCSPRATAMLEVKGVS